MNEGASGGGEGRRKKRRKKNFCIQSAARTGRACSDMRQILPNAQILLNGCNDFKGRRQRSSGRCVTLTSYREYANVARQRAGAAAPGPRLCQEWGAQRAAREKRGDDRKCTRHRSGGASFGNALFQETIRNRTRPSSRQECCLMDVYISCLDSSNFC